MDTNKNKQNGNNNSVLDFSVFFLLFRKKTEILQHVPAVWINTVKKKYSSVIQGNLNFLK